METYKINEMTRKESTEFFGTWFAQDATPVEIAAKCAARLELMEEWRKNLTNLKSVQEILVLEQKKADMKKTVSSMSADEKAEMIKLLNE